MVIGDKVLENAFEVVSSAFSKTAVKRDGYDSRFDDYDSMVKDFATKYNPGYEDMLKSKKYPESFLADYQKIVDIGKNLNEERHGLLKELEELKDSEDYTILERKTKELNDIIGSKKKRTDKNLDNFFRYTGLVPQLDVAYQCISSGKITNPLFTYLDPLCQLEEKLEIKKGFITLLIYPDRIDVDELLKKSIVPAPDCMFGGKQSIDFIGMVNPDFELERKGPREITDSIAYGGGPQRKSEFVNVKKDLIDEEPEDVEYSRDAPEYDPAYA